MEDKMKEQVEGDVSASLKVEVTGVTVGEAAAKAQIDLMGLTEHLRLEDSEKYREAFSLLWPNGLGMVHKSKLTQFFQSVLGPLYSEEMVSCLLDTLEPDQDGNVTLESFVQAFSLKYWSPESVAAMYEVLSSNPDIVCKIADWKSILGRFGCDMSDEQINDTMLEAQKSAKNLLFKELSKSEIEKPDKDTVQKKSLEILNAIKEKMVFLEQGEKANMSAGETKGLQKEPSDPKEDKKQLQSEEHPAELSKQN